jgi:hypothetical protein
VPQAVLLASGKVLLAGGLDRNYTEAVSCEIYDPLSGVWTPAGDMGYRRRHHTLTMLPSGKVLVVGGAFSYSTLSSSEILTPVPTVTSPSTAGGVKDRQFVYQITGSGGVTTYGASALPAGLSVDAATGVVSGSPSATGTTTAVITVTNDEGSDSIPVTITIFAEQEARIAASDPLAGEQPGDNGSFTVSLLCPVVEETTVNLSISGGATASIDYASLPSSVIFPAGTTSIVLPVLPILDSSPEGPEMVTANILAGIGYTPAPPTSASIIISDSPGTVQLAAATTTTIESISACEITVSRTGGSGGVVSVQYATTNATATAGEDYAAASGILLWADGDMSDKTISIPILQDVLGESAEAFTIALSAPSGGVVLGIASSATVVIVDDDGLGTGEKEDSNGHGCGSGSGFAILMLIALGGIGLYARRIHP